MTGFEKKLLQGQQHIQSNDIELSSYIKKIGDCKYSLSQDYFQSLVNSIISQQLSTKATSTISNRLIDLVDGGLTPQNLKQLEIADLRTVGLSRNKAGYILSLASQYKSESFKNLSNLDDKNIIEFLTSFKGIGEWTAQMFLIFSLGRLDVLPINDVGVRNGVKEIYSIEELSDEELIRIASFWQPYRSIGAWYSWRVIDGDGM